MEDLPIGSKPKDVTIASLAVRIGERIILEVVEATSFSCKGCFFAKTGYACPDNCYTRLDGTNVIFKEVKE